MPNKSLMGYTAQHQQLKLNPNSINNYMWATKSLLSSNIGTAALISSSLFFLVQTSLKLTSHTRRRRRTRQPQQDPQQ